MEKTEGISIYNSNIDSLESDPNETLSFEVHSSIDFEIFWTQVEVKNLTQRVLEEYS